jgi:hypothetical protein
MISLFARRSNLAAAVLALSVSAMLAPTAATAQESDGWNFRVTPYLWMLSLDGTTAALGNDVPVEADFGDILDLLNVALSHRRSNRRHCRNSIDHSGRTRGH